MGVGDPRNQGTKWWGIKLKERVIWLPNWERGNKESIRGLNPGTKDPIGGKTGKNWLIVGRIRNPLKPRIIGKKGPETGNIMEKG